VLFRGPNCRNQSDLPGACAEEDASALCAESDQEVSSRRLRPQQRCPQRCGSKNGELSMGITTFMRELIDPYWWTVALTSLVQFVLFLRWLYRRIRNDEMTRTFVEDMAINHLPHIYRLLEKLCDEKGIEAPPEPPIRWVNLNGPHH
ncbi:MAG: hypothetical protein WCC97_19225, partial [Candidatus Acidiferrales bacterium]